MMRVGSPIVDRESLQWPGGARVAFYVGLNVEHFAVGRLSTSIWEATSTLVPDPLNHGWRDYGPRVGIWRLIEIFDRHGVRPSVLLNAEAGERYPQIVKDQVDQLVADADADAGGRVMALALDPFVAGQAFRARYLDEALAYVAGHPDVWVTTSDEIAAHHREAAQG